MRARKQNRNRDSRSDGHENTNTTTLRTEYVHIYFSVILVPAIMECAVINSITRQQRKNMFQRYRIQFPNRTRTQLVLVFFICYVRTLQRHCNVENRVITTAAAAQCSAVTSCCVRFSLRWIECRATVSLDPFSKSPHCWKN